MHGLKRQIALLGGKTLDLLSFVLCEFSCTAGEYGGEYGWIYIDWCKC